MNINFKTKAMENLQATIREHDVMGRKESIRTQINRLFMLLRDSYLQHL